MNVHSKLAQIADGFAVISTRKELKYTTVRVGVVDGKALNLFRYRSSSAITKQKIQYATRTPT